MSHTPPINIRALAKKGVLDEKRFFQLLSAQNNYVDPKMVENFYMGLVRLITKELREQGVVRLPHLGDFALVKQTSRIGWAGKVQKMITGKYSLKFYAKEAWREYFTKFTSNPGLSGAIDPREKVLGHTLEEYEVGE